MLAFILHTGMRMSYGYKNYFFLSFLHNYLNKNFREDASFSSSYGWEVGEGEA